ncbi:MAG TPA: hypothetical protein VGK20_11570 [Candidatus Binatia bacterium]
MNGINLEVDAMASGLESAIDELLEQLRKEEQSVIDTKKMINKLSARLHRPEPYADVGEATIASISAIRSDQFYGQPLATVVREILMMRKSAGLGAAEIDEIFTLLKRGGFAFEGDDVDARRGVAISLAKNSVVFHRVPSGAWGLREWYPGLKDEQKQKRPRKKGDETVTAVAADEPDDGGDTAAA